MMWIAQTGSPDENGEFEARLSTEVEEVAEEWKRQGLVVAELTKEDFLRDSETCMNTIKVVNGKPTNAKRSRPSPPPSRSQLRQLVDSMSEEEAAAFVSLLKRR